VSTLNREFCVKKIKSILSLLPRSFVPTVLLCKLWGNEVPVFYLEEK